MVSSPDGINLRLSKDNPRAQPKPALIIAHDLFNHLGLYGADGGILFRRLTATNNLKINVHGLF